MSKQKKDSMELKTDKLKLANLSNRNIKKNEKMNISLRPVGYHQVEQHTHIINTQNKR